MHRHLPAVQTVGSSPPLTPRSPCGRLPLDMNLRRNRRLHKENTIARGGLCLGRQGFLNPSPPRVSEQGTSISPVCHVSLLTEKKYSSPFSPVHPESHLPTPVYSTFHISVPRSHLHLKAPHCIYIYYDYTRFFFTVNVFVLHPILFGSLLVALMWNVCAEPIECCVYIKATLFLTIPACVV